MMLGVGEDNELPESLLVEFIRLHEAGLSPEPATFISRAGSAGRRLRELIAVYLAEAPPVVPTDEAAAELAGRLRRAADPVADPLVEFIRLHEAGLSPEPATFISRAGSAGPRLRELIAVYLAEAPPVVPTDEAAGDLARRWGLGSTPVEVAGKPEPAPEDLRAWLLGRWGEATVAARDQLIEGLTGAIFGISLQPEVLRGTKERSFVPLDHSSGARLETRPDRCLWLLAFGLQREAVGTRPLVAIAEAADFGGPGFEWDGGERGLPAGIAEAAEPVGESGELQVRIGRMTHADDPAPVPSRLWILGIDEGDGGDAS